VNPVTRSTLAAALAALLALGFASTEAKAQQNPAAVPMHTHYRVVFIGSLAGPSNHFPIYGAHILNNDGSFVGWADVGLPDPYPDNCWDSDECIVAHAFFWKNGRIFDLGSLADGYSSDVNWMSPGGLISGESQTGQIDPDIGWTMHGTLWVHGHLIDLGTLEGGPTSLTTSVNDFGEVSGFALNTIPDPYSMFGGNQTRAYRWKNGTMMDLGTLGGPDAMAMRINQRGQIAGNSYINYDPSDACVLRTGGFFWENGVMTDVGGFGGTCTTVGDMNERGQIVGGSFLAGDQAQHAFLWQRGKLTDLGTLGGNFASALRVNDVGDVVGFQSLRTDDAVVHATLWTRGRILDLGALAPGGCSYASSVNSRLQVVGINSSDCGFGDDSNRAVISEGAGQIVDLNSLIPPNSGVQLLNASVINELGEIVAVGRFADGRHSPVLLVPCDSGPQTPVASCSNIGAPPSARLMAPLQTRPAASPKMYNISPWLDGKILFGPMGRLPRKR